ncbi:tRNA (adenine(58)-N(1))-methyltransferase non-catalytic subunit trm6 [Sporothrix bragantina]|uniref:Protein disulfide-isomerase n=1 Tax=Sporothrix bragantina TaxID=671064 RepID=A0ABP0AWB8_9PEZI
MRPSTSAALLALAISPAVAWSHSSEADFRKALKNNDRTLVAFIEPSLQSCKQLDTEWTSLTSTDAVILSIDCTKDDGLCDELDVASYPAIRLFHRDGRVQRYRGVREASELVSFLRRMARPLLSSVDERNLTSILTADPDEIIFVARYSSDDSTLREKVSKLASAYADRYTFATAASPSSSSSTITCYRGSEKLAVRTAAELAHATTALDSFLLDVCATPLVVNLTPRNEQHILDPNLGKSLVHFLYRTPDERRAYAAAVRSLAQTYRDYLVFTTIDVREHGDAMVSSLGLGEAYHDKKDIKRPLLSVQNPSNGDVFPFQGSPEDNNGPLTASVIEKFLMDIIQGVVQPWRPGAEFAQKHDEL